MRSGVTLVVRRLPVVLAVLLSGCYGADRLRATVASFSDATIRFRTLHRPGIDGLPLYDWIEPVAEYGKGNQLCRLPLRQDEFYRSVERDDLAVVAHHRMAKKAALIVAGAAAFALVIGSIETGFEIQARRDLACDPTVPYNNCPLMPDHTPRSLGLGLSLIPLVAGVILMGSGIAYDRDPVGVPEAMRLADAHNAALTTTSGLPPACNTGPAGR